MTLRERAAALLDVVDEYRDRECRMVLDRAHYEAATLARRAHAEARHRVHQIVIAERQRATAAIRAAQAELQTARRHHRRRRDLALLDLVWPRLEAALQRRWDAPAARRRWVDDLVAAAIQRLPAGPWTLTHPPSWPPTERDAVVAQVTAACGAPPRLVADEEMGAGLLVTSGTTTLDGSIGGLLADHPAVAGRLLALVPAEDASAPSTPTPGNRPLAPSSPVGERGLAPTAGGQSPLAGEGRGEGDVGSAVEGGEP